jgi:hypothetical protein
VYNKCPSENSQPISSKKFKAWDLKFDAFYESPRILEF